MAVLYINGFEHGLIPTAASQLATSGGLYSSLLIVGTGAFAIETAIVRPGGSLRSLRVSCPVVGDVARFTVPLVLSSVLVARFGIYVSTGGMPASETLDIFSDAARGGFKLRTNASSVVSIEQWTGGAPTGGSSIVLSRDTWHYIDIRFDFTTTTWALDMTVDGVAATQMQLAGQVALSNVQAYIGSGAAAASTATRQAYFDDLVISSTSGDYPLGDGHIVGYATTGVGTHSLDAATSAYYFGEIGAADTALTTSETTSYQNLDETPIGSGTDRIIHQSAVGASHFIDPTADGANNAWTKSTGTAGWSLLDDATRQPTAPSTATDRVTSLTAGQLQDLVFPNTLVYDATATYIVWLYGIGGARRGVDILTSVNDGTSYGSQSQMIAAQASAVAAGWHSVDITSLITNQTTLDQLRVRLICTVVSGGGATVCEVDEVYVEQVAASTFAAATTYAEYSFAQEFIAPPRYVQVETSVVGSAGTGRAVAKLYDGTSVGTAYTQAGLGGTDYPVGLFTAKPSGGAWTAAAFNALRARLGYPIDGNIIKYEGLYIEADYPPYIVLPSRDIHGPGSLGPRVVGQAVNRASGF